MELLLKRKFKGETYTIGDLFIDGVFFCNTLEDTVRDLRPLCPDTPQYVKCQCSEKEYAETAIPCGTYKVTLTPSPRFKRILPRIHDVPHFLGILIHNGVHSGHTSGCVLLGKNTVKGQLTESCKALEDLMRRMKHQKSIHITVE